VFILLPAVSIDDFNNITSLIAVVIDLSLYASFKEFNSNCVDEIVSFALPILDIKSIILPP